MLLLRDMSDISTETQPKYSNLVHSSSNPWAGLCSGGHAFLVGLHSSGVQQFEIEVITEQGRIEAVPVDTERYGHLKECWPSSCGCEQANSPVMRSVMLTMLALCGGGILFDAGTEVWRKLTGAKEKEEAELEGSWYYNNAVNHYTIKRRTDGLLSFVEKMSGDKVMKGTLKDERGWFVADLSNGGQCVDWPKGQNMEAFLPGKWFPSSLNLGPRSPKDYFGGWG